MHGYIYEVEATEAKVIPFKNIPCARLGTAPMEVTGCIEVKNAWDLFQDYLKQGKMRLSRYEDKSERQLEWWWSDLCGYLKEKDMINMPDCSYARFVREKFPWVWERYLAGEDRRTNGV